MWLLVSNAANMAFALGAAIVSYFLIRRSRRYLAQSNRNPAGQNPSVRTLQNQVSSTPIAASAFSRAEVQLHDTARELMGQLDSKMSALQALTLMAGEAAQRLEAAVERAERLGVTLHRDTLEQLADFPGQDQAAAQEILTELTGRPDRPLRVDQEDNVPLILRLARVGKNAESIADELGIPVGDVEMLLSLHR